MQESVQYIAWQLARTQGILVIIVGHLGNFQVFFATSQQYSNEIQDFLLIFVVKKKSHNVKFTTKVQDF